MVVSISFPPLANFLIPPGNMYEGLVDELDWYEVKINLSYFQYA